MRVSYMNPTVIGPHASSLRYTPELDGEGRIMESRQNTPFPSLADVEREHILKVYQANSLNKSKTARVLGIDVKTLYNKLKAYGLYTADTRLQDS